MMTTPPIFLRRSRLYENLGWCTRLDQHIKAHLEVHWQIYIGSMELQPLNQPICEPINWVVHVWRQPTRLFATQLVCVYHNTFVGNGPTHPQMATIPAQRMLHNFCTHSWLMDMIYTWWYFDMHLCPYSLLMLDMLNHSKHFAMCFYSLTNIKLCWAFIQRVCVAVMHHDCGEYICDHTSWNVQMDQFNICLHTHMVRVTPKQGFTWNFDSKLMGSVDERSSCLCPNNKLTVDKMLSRLRPTTSSLLTKGLCASSDPPCLGTRFLLERKCFVLDLGH